MNWHDEAAPSCPLCGSSRLAVKTMPDGKINTRQALCLGCGATGPSVSNHLWQGLANEARSLSFRYTTYVSGKDMVAE